MTSTTWTHLPSDGTDIAPVDIFSTRFGFGDDGLHIKGTAMIAGVEADMISFVGGPFYFEIDILAVEGDQDRELHIAPTPVDSVEDAKAIIDRTINTFNAEQAATILPG